MTPDVDTTRRSIRGNAIIGVAVALLLIFGLGGWAATTELSGAVVTSGLLVVETNAKKVQHPTGGIVSAIFVRDGSKVAAGDLLVHLDETVVRANLAIIVKSHDELDARQSRLRAEREGQAEIRFSEALLARQSEPEVLSILEEESRLFKTRRSARNGQKAQLNERIGQIKEELNGIAGQIEAKGREIDLISQELDGVRQLWRKNLVPITRLTALEREAVRLGGERSQLRASTAQLNGKITEIELQIAQIDQDLQSETSKDLREAQAKMSELIERKVAADDQLRRIDIRAPQEGMIHQLAVHTVGGVINAGEQLMLIIPVEDELTVEAKILPQHIDQIAVGQAAALRLSAFNQRTTPELNGLVKTVSADISQDRLTGAPYYTARITMSAAEVAKLKGLKLVPGMPVEAFVKTDERTVMSFLMKPLQDQVAKAFRER